MAEALYALEGALAVPSPLTAGPWDPGAQHGSAPAALLTHVVEGLPAPAPMQLARLTLDLMRPVPIAPLSIATEILREGRKIQVVALTLSAAGKLCVRATALRVRREAAALPDAAAIAPTGYVAPETLPQAPGAVGRPGFVGTLDMRLAKGGGPMSASGPSAIWFRIGVPVVAGAGTSPAMRAALAADFCNGISSSLPFTEWQFINGDLTVNLAREPVGDWVLCDATTWYGADGAAVAFAALGDARGWLGRSAQSLVIERR